MSGKEEERREEPSINLAEQVGTDFKKDLKRKTDESIDKDETKMQQNDSKKVRSENKPLKVALLNTEDSEYYGKDIFCMFQVRKVLALCFYFFFTSIYPSLALFIF